MGVSPALLITAACGATVIGYITGLVLGFAWVHPLPFFGIVLVGALASLRLHRPSGRAVGVAVDAVRLVREAA